jgi:hypothetical protein
MTIWAAFGRKDSNRLLESLAIAGWDRTFGLLE